MARIVVSFNGVATKGPITVSGVKIGDQIISAVFTAVPVGDENLIGNDATGTFSKFVFVHGQIFQIPASDFTGITMTVVLDRDLII